MDERDVAMIDALRRAHEAFSRGDFDAAVEIAHPEVEFVPPGGQASRRGAEALPKVLVRQHAQARGAGSGIELDIENWTVWTFDDDLLVTRVESYLPHQESDALEAAGLRE